MSKGKGQQIERWLDHELATDHGQKPWGKVKHSHKKEKRWKHKSERKRSNDDPECFPNYKKYKGWEY